VIPRSADKRYNLTDLHDFPDSICLIALPINLYNLVNIECNRHRDAQLRATEFLGPGRDIRPVYQERQQRRHDEKHSYQGENEQRCR